ncbi:MAG: hypothetical protein LUC45_09635 [Paraprevotella sp.]|nr:hypothetical protein [Paraprevotella sp.]
MMHKLFFLVSFLAAGTSLSYGNPGSIPDENSGLSKSVPAQGLLNRDDLTAGGSLFHPFSAGERDSILKQVQSCELPSQGEHAGTRASVHDSYRFFPVIEAYKNEAGDRSFRPTKDAVCLDETQQTYYLASFSDHSNFKKEDNPDMYEANKEVFGQKFADEMVRRYKEKKWIVSFVSEEGNMYNAIRYAVETSDDGSFFALKPLEHSIEVCYFKDGKPFICKKGTDGNIAGKALQ